jgi:uncharacterized membrane protein (DUF106 family)
MKFIKTYAITLILCYIFVFFGGWMLFDFSRRFYVAIAACAFIIAAVVSVFVMQAEKMEQLEKRMKALEEKDSSGQRPADTAADAERAGVNGESQ